MSSRRTAPSSGGSSAMIASLPGPPMPRLARVYQLARLHVNFFQPVEKLVTKTRNGARVRRVYDRAQTPYQRLCAAGVLRRRKPTSSTHSINGSIRLQLRRDLEAALERLWTLAAPDPHRPQGSTEPAPPPQSPLLAPPRRGLR